MRRAPLAVVVPVLDEAAILSELVRRVRDGALAADADARVLFVDDGSTDATPALAAGLSDEVVTFLRLPANRGQLAATLAGLAATDADVFAVLDGDLQDPPELIPELVGALARAPRADAAFAVKVARDDGLAMRVASRLHQAVLARVARRPPPAGAGSFCAMRREVVAHALASGSTHANLATLVAAAADAYVTVPYRKAARYDGRSRVGLLGLVREALASLRASRSASGPRR
jgi:glycosyltransferase involved in cell wall biosynthesis